MTEGHNHSHFTRSTVSNNSGNSKYSKSLRFKAISETYKLSDSLLLSKVKMTNSDSDLDDKSKVRGAGSHHLHKRINDIILESLMTFNQPDKQNASTFIKAFEQAMVDMGVTQDHYKLLYFGYKLGGLAKQWFQLCRSSNPSLTYDNMKSLFIVQFRRAGVTPRDMLKYLNSKKFKQQCELDESIQAYALRCLQKFDEYNSVCANVDKTKLLTEDDKITYYIDGLGPEYIESTITKFQNVDGTYVTGTNLTDVIEFTGQLENTSSKVTARVEDMENVRIEEDAIRSINAINIKPKSAHNLNKVVKDKVVENSEIDKLKISIKEITEHNKRSDDKFEAIHKAIQNSNNSVKTLSMKLDQDYNRSNIQCNVGANEQNNEQHRTLLGAGNKVVYHRPNQDVRDRRANNGSIKCYRCGLMGHYATQCNSAQSIVDEYQKKQNEQKRLNNNYVSQIQSNSISNITDNNSSLSQQDFRSGSDSQSNVQVSSGNTNNINNVSIDNNNSSINETSNQAEQWQQNDIVGQINTIVHRVNHSQSNITSSISSALISSKGRINDVNIPHIVFDNGASLSCLSYKVFSQFSKLQQSSLKKLKNHQQLHGPSGEKLLCIGTIIVDVYLPTIKGEIYIKDCELVVIKDLQQHCLLGNNVMGKNNFKSYTLDLEENKLILYSQKGGHATVLLNDNTTTFDDATTSSVNNIYLSRSITIKPNSVMNVSSIAKVSVPAVNDDILLCSFDESLVPDNIIISDVIISSYQSNVPITIKNASDKPITIKAGNIIGNCEVIDKKDIQVLYKNNNDNNSSSDNMHRVNNVMLDPDDEDDDLTTGWIFDKPSDVDIDSLKINTNVIESFDYSKIKSVDQNTINKLKLLFEKYSSVFAENPSGPQQTDLIEHSIEFIDPNQQPIRLPPYRESPNNAGKTRELIMDMLKNKIIEASSSPYAAPIVVVVKSDGSFRFCADYRKVNTATKSNAYTIPRIDDILDQMDGAIWFTTMDLASAFWQIKMKESDKEKTAFICREGLFQFRVMPFGLKNSPSTFQTMIVKALGELNWKNATAYLDDIVIFSKSIDDHLLHIEQVLMKMKIHKLSIKLKKCEFFAVEVNFLGHIIGRDGIKVQPLKVDVINKFPKPKTPRDVKSFLGMVNFYRKHIPNCSRIQIPLNKLTRLNHTFKWNDECEESFNKLKLALSTAPVLAFPDYTQQFILTTDASGIALGAVISQLHNESERVICYASRSLNGAEINYCTTEKECLAVIWSTKLFRHYLYGVKFKIRTDHGSLVWLMNSKDFTGRLMRWSLKLSEYDFDIEYIPGKSNAVADALSRVVINNVDILTNNDKDNDVIISDIDNINSKLDQVKLMQYDDAELKPMIDYLLNGIEPDNDRQLQKLLIESNLYCLIDGVLYHLWQQSLRQPRMEMIRQLVIPKILRPEILVSCHEDLLAGHYGVSRTYERIRNRFYWNGMYKDCYEWVISCITCETKKMPRFTGAEIPQSLTHRPSAAPGVDWCVDLLEFPRSNRGNRYACVFMDRYSRFPEAFAISNKLAETIAEVFIKEIVCRYGCPKTLLSDRGKEFINEIADSLAYLLNVRKLNTSGYRPQTNGQVERFNGTLAQTISAYVSNGHKDWDDFLPYACFAYRTIKNETTKETPFYLLFSREAKMPIDIVYNTGEQPFINQHQCILEMTRRMREASLLFEQQQSVLLDEKIKMNDNIKRKVQYKIGDTVLLYKRMIKKGRSAKLTHMWHGPYIVVKPMNNGINYKVKLLNSGKKQQVAHAANMKLFTTPDKTSLIRSLKRNDDIEVDNNESSENYIDDTNIVTGGANDEPITTPESLLEPIVESTLGNDAVDVDDDVSSPWKYVNKILKVKVDDENNLMYLVELVDKNNSINNEWINVIELEHPLIYNAKVKIDEFENEHQLNELKKIAMSSRVTRRSTVARELLAQSNNL